MSQTAKVCILLLNWNRWADTLECLESVFRISYAHYTVVVCDNGSTDESVDRIASWARGNLSVIPVSADLSIRRLSSPPVEKPVRHCEYERAEVDVVAAQPDHDLPLTLIRNGANLGFAAGNNVGIRYAMQRNFDYVWILNNDTVVTRDALSQMVTRIRATPNAGMCGAKLLYYYRPDTIQAAGGGRFNKWVGSNRLLGANRPADTPVDATNLSFISGASLLVSRAFIEDVGLMSEEYFLYYEEIDWITRSQGRYSLTYEPNSIVFHKEGATIGPTSDRTRTSALSDYYGIRGRFLFAKRHFPYTLPTVYLGVIVALFNRLLRRKFDRALMILRLLLSPFNTRVG